MPPPKSNVALLTEGAGYIQRAKKARQDQVESIKFDDAARSKRKKARVEAKRSRAKEREKQEHLEERRQARQDLKERAKQNVKSVRAAMGLEELNSSDEEDEDEEDEDGNAEAGPSRQDVEFEDEDQVATVTVIEDFDPSSLAPVRRIRSSESPDVAFGKEKEPEKKRMKLPEIPASSKRAAQKAKREKEKKKEDKKKSRSMETKSERKLGRAMEAKRRSKKAGLAIERDGRQRGKGGSRGKGKRR